MIEAGPGNYSADSSKSNPSTRSRRRSRFVGHDNTGDKSYSTTRNRRSANATADSKTHNPFAGYDVSYEFAGCQEEDGLITGVKVGTDQTNMSDPRITILEPVCSKNFTFRSTFMGGRTSMVSYQCAPGSFFEKWIVFTEGNEGPYAEYIQSLSVQPVCSDGTSMPIIGKSKGSRYLLLDVATDGSRGKNISMVTETWSLRDPKNAYTAVQNVTVLSEFMGVRNKHQPVPDRTKMLSFSCERPFDRITRVDATLTRVSDEVGWFNMGSLDTVDVLSDLQVCDRTLFVYMFLLLLQTRSDYFQYLFW